MQKPTRITGEVVKEPFARGSKSAHEAVMLLAGDERYVLRRQGGNAFHDPALEQLVGKTIHCTGAVAGYTFLMSEWAEA